MGIEVTFIRGRKNSSNLPLAQAEFSAPQGSRDRPNYHQYPGPCGCGTSCLVHRMRTRGMVVGSK